VKEDQENQVVYKGDEEEAHQHAEVFSLNAAWICNCIDTDAHSGHRHEIWAVKHSETGDNQVSEQHNLGQVLPWHIVIAVLRRNLFCLSIHLLLKILLLLEEGMVTFLLLSEFLCLLHVNSLLDLLDGLVEETEGVRELLDVVRHLLLGGDLFLELVLFCRDLSLEARHVMLHQVNHDNKLRPIVHFTLNSVG